MTATSDIPDIPGHRVEDVIGEGGFATVYRGWQVAVDREVAVKVDNRLLLSERDRRRFTREVTAAGRLSGHPHVIALYDAGTLGDGRPYMVMEFCPEGSLADAVRRDGAMTPAQVRDIGIKIADALAAAHAADVLHRDIKPANILVNRYGMVGLSDFGLASILTFEGEQSVTREALTPAYASPERFRGEEPTVACDLYSLAATLYGLLAGRPPHFPADGGTPSVAELIALHDKPVDDIPGAPPELMATLRGSLEADPAARPRSAVELRDALIGVPESRLGQATVAPAVGRGDGAGVELRDALIGVPESRLGQATVAPAVAQGDRAVAESTVQSAPPGISAPPAERSPLAGLTRVDGVARRRRPKARLAVLAAAAVVIVATAVVFGMRALSPGAAASQTLVSTQTPTQAPPQTPTQTPTKTPLQTKTPAKAQPQTQPQTRTQPQTQSATATQPTTQPQPTTQSQTQPEPQPPVSLPSPTGWWKLTDGSGTVAADAVGDADPATALNVSWSANNGAEFNGTDSLFVTGSTVLQTGPGASFTVAARLLMSTPTSYSEAAVSQDGGTNSGFYLQYLRFAGAATGSWAFSRSSSNTVNPAIDYWALSNEPAAIGTWTFLVGVFNGATNQLELYVNGVLQNDVVTDPTPYAATGDLAIGRAQFGGQPVNWYTGLLNNVEVWNTALSGAQVKQLSVERSG